MKEILRKKCMYLLAGMLLLGNLEILASPILLIPGNDDVVPGTPGHGKLPARVPELWQDDHVLTFQSAHADLTLRLLDAGGNEVYSTPVSASTNMVVLPATLTGSYVLRLETDTYYYIGYIFL